MKIRVLAIDPSFANFGMAVVSVDVNTLDIEVEKLLLVKTEGQAGKTVRKNSDDLRRARDLIAGMRDMAQGCSLAIAEVPTGTQSARASWSLGIAVGVLAGCPIPLIEVNPTEVKKASVGTKTASKQEMIEWATTKYPHSNWLRTKRKGEMALVNDNEHLADAVAAAHAGVLTEQFRSAVAMMRSMVA